MIATPSDASSELCVVLEPDGIGTAGHYVRWHGRLVEALSQRFGRTLVLCNARQDPALYGCRAIPTFSDFSWSVGRTRNPTFKSLMSTRAVQRFIAELRAALRACAAECSGSTLSLYMYYGSVQILQALQEVKGQLELEGIDLRVTMCAFHESVLLGDATEPFFPEGSQALLEHAAAHPHDYRILSVSGRLAQLIGERFGVQLETQPNPIPGQADAAPPPAPRPAHDAGPLRVLFPGRLREEKGAAVTQAFVERVAAGDFDSEFRVQVHGAPFEGLPASPWIEFLGQDVPDAAYRQSLLDADVVVVPYTAPHFTYRTSGIVVDVLWAGKPCVVLQRTWLADVVDALRAGLSVEPLGPYSIAAALRVVGADAARFRRHAREAYARYAAEHSWALLASAVLA